MAKKRIVFFSILLLVLCIFIFLSGMNSETVPKNNLMAEDITEDIENNITIKNPFFYTQKTIYLTADIEFYADVETLTVMSKELNIRWLKNYEKGDLFKLSIEPIENAYYLDESRLNFYFYVTSDEIYRLWPYVIQDQEVISFYNNDELLMELLDTDEKLIENGELVCCKEDVADELESGEVGSHVTIQYSISQVVYNRADVKPNSELDYYESFVWEEGKGLVEYRSGYRAEAEILYIDNIIMITEDNSQAMLEGEGSSFNKNL